MSSKYLFFQSDTVSVTASADTWTYVNDIQNLDFTLDYYGRYVVIVCADYSVGQPTGVHLQANSGSYSTVAIQGHNEYVYPMKTSSSQSSALYPSGSNKITTITVIEGNEHSYIYGRWGSSGTYDVSIICLKIS